MGLFGLLFGTAKAQTPESRKAQSIAQLSREGVPFTEHLPHIESEDEALERSAQEIADRALGAMIAAVKGETRDDALVANVIAQFDAQDVFTPQERAFLDDKDPSDADCIKFAWRYEGVLVMLWALGYFPALPYPSDIVAVPDMGAIFRERGRDGLLAGAKKRSLSELLDAADLAYRYHWATVDARINGREAPAGLDAGVVYERHYALNWLIGYSGQPWDEITTDT